MKNFTLLSWVAAAAGMMTLTSCLGEGSNTQTGTMYGVVDYLPSLLMPAVYVADDYPVYSTAFSALTSGDCVVFYASIDYDAQTSSEYITATVADCVKLNKWYADPEVDTDYVYANEMTFTEAALAWNLSKGYMFVATAHPSISSNQESSFKMMYDLDNPVSVEGNRVYELVLRAQKVADGTAVAASGTTVNAFYVSSFFSSASQREQEQGAENVYFRFKYPESFNSDTTEITSWGTSETITYTITDDSSSY